MKGSRASGFLWLGGVWLAVGAGSVALVRSTHEWEVYNNTGSDGGTGMFVDVAFAFMGIWLIAVPLAFITWKWAHSAVSRTMGFMVTALVAAIFCWVSTYSVQGFSHVQDIAEPTKGTSAWVGVA